jgi:hypothetical protein
LQSIRQRRKRTGSQGALIAINRVDTPLPTIPSPSTTPGLTQISAAYPLAPLAIGAGAEQAAISKATVPQIVPFMCRTALPVRHRDPKKTRENGAGYRIRTRGPLITNQVLYQLS